MFSGTDMTVNPKGREELLAAYGVGPDVSSDVRAAAEAAAGNIDPSELSGQAAELAAMRAAMKPKPKPSPES